MLGRVLFDGVRWFRGTLSSETIADLLSSKVANFGSLSEFPMPPEAKGGGDSALGPDNVGAI